MELLLILGSGGVLIGIAWIVGFVRAVRRASHRSTID